MNGKASGYMFMHSFADDIYTIDEMELPYEYNRYIKKDNEWNIEEFEEWLENKKRE